jgi:hypothetical protein
MERMLEALSGDLCMSRLASEDGEWLESAGATFHRDAEPLTATSETVNVSRPN